ncbi:11067_t:CDS:2 [Funneliformis geosporum]|nr:11067_t:CDS:2 [Funneliformis geosporum]
MSPGMLLSRNLSGEWLQPRRYKAHLMGITYAYDFPELFHQAIDVLKAKELVLDENNNLQELERASRTNSFGMVAWIFTHFTPMVERLSDNTQSWISAVTISRWHREVSELHVRNIFQQANQSNKFAFGIVLVECFMFWNSAKNMTDVILLETKNLQRCDSDTISQALIETCTKYNINTAQCLTFLSDNTNYMSDHIGGAVEKFNRLAKCNRFVDYTCYV